MLITAHMDESGTHDSGLTLVSAWLGSVRQWFNFEKELRGLFRAHKLKVFHAKELRDGDGEFAGWSVNKKARFIDDMSDIANRVLEVGCSAILKDAEYAEFYNNGKGSRKARYDTRYGVCFRAALTFAVQMAADRKSATWNKERRTLNVVAECGHVNAADALRIFDEFKGGNIPREDKYRNVMGAMSFASKADCLPLAIADSAAYHTWRQEKGFQPMRIRINALKSEVSYRRNYYRLVVGEESLRALKETVITSLRSS